jgi:hypothetical protein
MYHGLHRVPDQPNIDLDHQSNSARPATTNDAEPPLVGLALNLHDQPIL